MIDNTAAYSGINRDFFPFHLTGLILLAILWIDSGCRGEYYLVLFLGHLPKQLEFVFMYCGLGHFGG